MKHPPNCLFGGPVRNNRAVESEFDGGNIVSFVLSANLHRRHMTPGQQAAIVASAQDWAQAHPAHRTKEAGNVATFSTTADRSAQSGASARTQRMADQVAKADPELAQKVAHGEVSLPKAAEQVGGSMAACCPSMPVRSPLRPHPASKRPQVIKI